MNEYERLRRQAEGLRSMYPPGTRVECLCMNDPFAPVPSGTKGSVMFVDDIAQIHVNWDNGSSLALRYLSLSLHKESIGHILHLVGMRMKYSKMFQAHGGKNE